MIFIEGGTQIRPRQIRLEELFAVQRVLASRGFEIIKEGNGENTILPRSTWTIEEANLIFNIFHDSLLRAELLAFIKSQSPLKAIETIQLQGIRDIKLDDRQSFSSTFEWYIGELLRRKFMAFSSSYGVDVKDVVRNSDNETAGDYDVLSILGDMELLYVECKSGKTTKRRHILNTVERSIALHAVASIILLGSELKIADLKQQLDHCLYPTTLTAKPSLNEISIKGVLDSTIYQWHNCYLIPADEVMGSMEPKLRTALRLIAAQRVTDIWNSFITSDSYDALGYSCKEIKPMQ